LAEGAGGHALLQLERKGAKRLPAKPLRKGGNPLGSNNFRNIFLDFGRCRDGKELLQLKATEF
jgi:hypothetical protein